MGLSWMAWTWPTAAFFGFILLCLVTITIWDLISPGGGSRHGVLGLDTTRGDRLFISLVLSAWVFLAWLGIMGMPLWAPLVISLALALLIFLFV